MINGQGAPRAPPQIIPDSLNIRGEARYILQCASDDYTAAKRAAFGEAMKRLRPLTEGRKHTPAEVLIGKDRDPVRRATARYSLSCSNVRSGRYRRSGCDGNGTKPYRS